MTAWNIEGEEAHIVLVGNFNPKIFHPEWFIRKEIVEEWDYKHDEVLHLQDVSQMVLPGNRKITVLLNQFTISTPLASEFSALKDIVSNTYSALRETPVKQMGMNYSALIHLRDKACWKRFGSQLAPNEPWMQEIAYLENLAEEKRDAMGVWEMIMNLPRPDDLIGQIRPKIAVKSLLDYNLTFSINNHVEIKNSSAMEMIQVLEKHWDTSLELATDMVERIMNSQLRDM